MTLHSFATLRIFGVAGENRKECCSACSKSEILHVRYKSTLLAW